MWYKTTLNFREPAESITRPLNLSLILLDYLQDANGKRLRNVLLAEYASSQVFNDMMIAHIALDWLQISQCNPALFEMKVRY